MDDDISVTAGDLTRMASVLRAQGNRRVVSPFPRWYDNNHNYLWLPTRAQHVGLVTLPPTANYIVLIVTIPVHLSSSPTHHHPHPSLPLPLLPPC
jgi:hypothetical protein